MRDHFLLDPDIIFLNHGSFGATPKPVFAAYQAWQRRLEQQPVLFLSGEREYAHHMRVARERLGEYVGVSADDVAYIPNATTGVNIVARSLPFAAGDEILTTDHEYGACDRAFQFVCQNTGAKIIRQPIPLPLTSTEEIIETIWAGVTPRTKLIFLSHITSSTAIRMPIESLCERARAHGILTLIDGAHAPGQLPLDLTTIGADFYTGNCHKWMLSPKGVGFLYTRREHQHHIDPLVISWGWGDHPEPDNGSRYINIMQWWGTHDPSAYLSVPTAIDFMAEHNWHTLTAHCHQQTTDWLTAMTALTGLPSIYPNDTFYHQLAVAPLPPIPNLKTRLYNHYRIEIPYIEWNDHQFIRISIQPYNTQHDIDTLLEAIESIAT